MRFIKTYYDTTFLLVLIWCILNESYTLNTLLVGLGAAILTVILVHFVFSDNDDVKNYRIKPTIFIHYFFVLLYQILLAGFHVTKSIFNHETQPTVVHIKTSVHNHWFQCIIANSITLTPGTVTIDKTDHEIQVLWLYPTTDDPEEQAKIILGSFEKILKKGDYKH